MKEWLAWFRVIGWYSYNVLVLVYVVLVLFGLEHIEIWRKFFCTCLALFFFSSYPPSGGRYPGVVFVSPSHIPLRFLPVLPSTEDPEQNRPEGYPTENSNQQLSTFLRCFHSPKCALRPHTHPLGNSIPHLLKISNFLHYLLLSSVIQVWKDFFLVILH